ncbi:hypothetical protein ACFXG4_10540 [Nocardia sp. NPDC059246]
MVDTFRIADGCIAEPRDLREEVPEITVRWAEPLFSTIALVPDPVAPQAM